MPRRTTLARVLALSGLSLHCSVLKETLVVRRTALSCPNRLPSFAEGHGCKPEVECEVGTLRSLGARPSQPKRLLRRSRQGEYASEGSALRSMWRGGTAARPS